MLASEISSQNKGNVSTMVQKVKLTSHITQAEADLAFAKVIRGAI